MLVSPANGTVYRRIHSLFYNYECCRRANHKYFFDMWFDSMEAVHCIKRDKMFELMQYIGNPERFDDYVRKFVEWKYGVGIEFFIHAAIPTCDHYFDDFYYEEALGCYED